VRSTSPPKAGSPRPAGMVEVPRLAEVIQLHTPTLPDPATRPAAAAGGDQLAFPLLFVIEGGGGGR
jgi:hypothetical protein